MFRVLGIALILLAIALIAVPTFTDCESQGEAIKVADGGTVPMKCHWSGIAEIGVGVPLYVVGAVMSSTRNRNILIILSVLGIVLGGLAIAFPTKLIGVCPSPTMMCATLMRPALVILGGSAIGISGTGLILSLPGLSKTPQFIIDITKKTVLWKGA
jgi:hypothetical protein